jgi:hypothetical protein
MYWPFAVTDFWLEDTVVECGGVAEVFAECIRVCGMTFFDVVVDGGSVLGVLKEELSEFGVADRDGSIVVFVEFVWGVFFEGGFDVDEVDGVIKVSAGEVF